MTAQAAPGSTISFPRGFASEAEHWYEPGTGQPRHSIIGANGKERATTLRDARKFGWYPSVTKILQVASRPGLELWKAEQLLMAALTLPRRPDEPEATWIGRVWDDSKEQAAKAAEAGTAIHAAIEQSIRGEPYDPALEPHVRGFWAAVNGWFGKLTDIRPERSFASRLGFGGKTDLVAKECLLDAKTKEGDLSEVKLYDEHAMQLGAYAFGMCVDVPCGIVFVSRTHPGVSRLMLLDQAEVTRGWDMFMHLLRFWQVQNNYFPGA